MNTKTLGGQLAVNFDATPAQLLGIKNDICLLLQARGIAIQPTDIWFRGQFAGLAKLG